MSKLVNNVNTRMEFKLAHIFQVIKNVFIGPKLMKFTQYFPIKILPLIGYKGHRVHIGGHGDPSFSGQKYVYI
jgi:hypothetical protein